MKRPNDLSDAVAVEIDGKVYEGTFRVESKTVIVETNFGRGTTQHGGLGPAPVARQVLRDIVAGAVARGDL